MNILKIATYSSSARWFSAVMATTMTAFACQLYGYNKISQYFFIAGLVIFLSVIVFMIARMVLFYKDTLHEILNPEKTLYFYTIAGTVNLAGVCLSKIFHLYTTAHIFWYAATGLWMTISFTSFSVLFLYQKAEDRKIEDVLHGGWLFAVLGTQSTAFLGTLVAEHATRHTIFIQLFSFALWSIGACLYLIFVSIIFLRLFFSRFSDITTISPYWMNIGAAAATALAGASLYQHIQIAGGPFSDLLPFLKGFSLFFWSVGLWWLPLLLILAIVKRINDTEGVMFTVGYWEIALTPGLYANGTFLLAGLFEGHYLPMLSKCFSVAAVALWCFASLFTIVHLIRSSIWVPVNEVTINHVVPCRFKLRGRVFHVKAVVNEWLDQNIKGVLRKCYTVTTRDNLTCLIFYNLQSKKWYFDPG